MVKENAYQPSPEEVRLAEYHFRMGLYIAWLASIYPDGPPVDAGWKPPVPLWAAPEGAPEYLVELAAEELERDAANQKAGLPALVAAVSIEEMQGLRKNPESTKASVILFVDKKGAVVEAWTASRDGGHAEDVQVRPDTSARESAGVSRGGWLAWPAGEAE